MKTQVKINDSDRQLMLTALDHAIEANYVHYKLCLRYDEDFVIEDARAHVLSLIKLHRRLQFGTDQERTDVRISRIEYRSDDPADCQRSRKFWVIAIESRHRKNPELRAPVGRGSRRAFNTQLAA